jgi:CrcB protein
MTTILAIAFFGAIGCIARYLLSGGVYALVGRAFPWGTLTVNLMGSFLIGLVMEAALRTTLISQELRLGLTIGFLGGFTTFSTFSYETFKLLEDGEFFTASINVLASVALCLVGTWAGIIAARQL